MCLLLLKKRKGEFSDNEFKLAWERNGNGFGFIALDRNNKILHIEKGIMDFQEALEKSRPFRVKGVQSIFHLRLQSVGPVSPDLCHPFRFDKDNKFRAVFQNGTLTNLAPDAGESDTSFAAQMLAILNTEDVDKLLTHFSNTSNSRFITVIENNKGEMDINIYANQESKWEGDVWLSNTRHRETPQNNHKPHKKHKK